MQENKSNAMYALNASISHITKNIDHYKKQPQDFTRNSKLPFEKLVKVMLNMQGNSLNAELQEAFPELSERMTASAYVQARNKLSLPVFEDLLSHYNQSAPKRLLNGKYRLYAIDGSDFTTPWNPQSAFVVDTNKRNGKSIKPFCQIHANIMYDIASRQYMDCVLQPRNSHDERAAALEMIGRMPKDDPFMIIMDRGYESFNLIETLNRTENCHYVIRVKVRNGIKEISRLPDEECDIEIAIPVTTSFAEYMKKRANGEPIYKINAHKRRYKETLSPKTVTQRWDFEDSCTIKFRIVKFLINDPDTGEETWEVLVTNLNRFEFPIAQMKELYHLRWDIETSFRDMKYSLGGMHFHSKKDEATQMEIYAHLIMFNAVARNVIAAEEWEAAQAEVVKQVAENAENSVIGEDTKYQYAIDFKMACLSTRRFFRLHSNEPITKLYEELLRYKQPIRLGRQDERNIKTKSAIAFAYRVA